MTNPAEPLPYLTLADLMAKGLDEPNTRDDQPIAIDTTPVRVTGEELYTIWWRGKQWAVTEYGIEALDGTYSFEAKRLAEDITVHSWVEHMSEKEWVDTEEFATCWLVALVLHGTKVEAQAVREAIAKGVVR